MTNAALLYHMSRAGLCAAVVSVAFGAFSTYQQIQITENYRLAQINESALSADKANALTKTDTGLDDVIDINSEDREALKQTAQRMDMDTVMRYIRDLSELTSQLRYSSQKRILIEVALIRLCHPEMSAVSAANVAPRTAQDEAAPAEQPRVQDAAVSVPAEYKYVLDDLKHRLDSVENRLASGSFSVSQQPVRKPEKPAALPEDVERIMKDWSSVTEAVGSPLDMYISSARRSLTSDGRLELVWAGDSREALNYSRVNSAEKKAQLESAIESVLGKHVDIAFTLTADRREMEENHYDLSQMFPGIEITTEDDTPDGYF